MAETEPLFSYFTLISDETGQEVLLQKLVDGWSFLNFMLPGHYFWQSVDHINQSVKEVFGLDVITLRCLNIRATPPCPELQLYYALECSKKETIPADCQWVSIQELGAIRFSQPAHREIMQQWLNWIHTDHTKRAPWYLPGWSAKAKSWIKNQTDQLGLSQNADPEQIRSWQRSSLWRISTSKEDYYFKAVHPEFSREPIITQALAFGFPKLFPTILACDTQAGFFFMKDSGKQTIEQCGELKQWKKVLSKYGQLQIALSSRLDWLKSQGLPDHSPKRLAKLLKKFFNDPTALKIGENPLTEWDIDALYNRMGEIELDWEALEASPIPLSIEHGDFWPGQILYQDGHFAFIDWSDCSISHPFFSMLFLYQREFEIPDTINAYEQLLDSYLDVWSDYAPRPKLLETYHLAQKLAPLHHAMLYYETILPNMEIQWEMGNMLPYYLRLYLFQVSRK